MSDRKYLYTERAHYMCPNMHFGIMAEIGAEFDANGINESTAVLKSAHPLMRSLIAEEQESSKVYYEEHPELAPETDPVEEAMQEAMKRDTK